MPVSPADPQWLEGAPIYRQLRDRVIALILDGSLKEGDAVPSVRQVAADFRINPLTVMKAYQALSDEGLLEKRRGLGMFVNAGARAALLSDERSRLMTRLMLSAPMVRPPSTGTMTTSSRPISV